MENEGQFNPLKEMLDEKEHKERPDKKHEHKTAEPETAKEKIKISSGEKIFEFEPDEEVLYTSLKGKEMSTIIVDKSKDSSNPGLILKDTNSNKVFAVNAESVAKRVRKLNTDDHTDSLGDTIKDAVEDSTEKSGEEKIHDNKKLSDEELPSISIDLTDHYEVGSGTTLATLLEDENVKEAYVKWGEEIGQDKKPQRLSSEKKTRKFINWAMQNTEIDFSKLLMEKKSQLPSDESEKKSKNQETSIKKEILQIRLNKKLQPLIEQWGKENAEKGKTFKKIATKDDLEAFEDWARIELEKIQDKKEEAQGGEPEELPSAMVDPELYAETEEEKINKTRQKITDIGREATGQQQAEKLQKLAQSRQNLVDFYGISLDEDGNPATPKDQNRVTKMMELAKDEDVKNLQRAGLFGKIRGFFTDLGASKKDEAQAKEFKKDFQKFNKLSAETLTEKYTSGGPIGRSIIRERGSVSTSVGSIETARHTPLKHLAPKRGRPRKTKA